MWRWVGLLAVWMLFFPFGSRRYTAPHTSHLLVIGNSITRHPPSEALGWPGDWGMAATTWEKDWVHCLVVRMPEDTALTILRGYAPDLTATVDALEGKVRSHRASVVVIQLGDNMGAADANDESLYQPMVRLIEAAFESRRHAQVIVLGTWGADDVRNELLRRVAEDGDAAFVPIHDLATRPNHRAWEQGVFDKPMVGWHPSDLGMAAIADRVADELGYE